MCGYEDEEIEEVSRLYFAHTKPINIDALVYLTFDRVCGPVNFKSLAFFIVDGVLQAHTLSVDEETYHDNIYIIDDRQGLSYLCLREFTGYILQPMHLFQKASTRDIVQKIRVELLQQPNLEEALKALIVKSRCSFRLREEPSV